VSTSVQLLKAAADIVGGTKQLAEHLGIGERLLERFMEGRRALPDVLLLRAADILLEDRQARMPTVAAHEATFRKEAQ
jgi:hypothetical protein